MSKALDFCQTNLSQYLNERYKIMLKTVTQDGKLEDLNILDLAGLLCYQDPVNSPYGYLFSDSQTR
jgi:hypothetical protein